MDVLCFISRTYVDFLNKAKHCSHVFAKSILFVKLNLHFNLQSTFLFFFFFFLDSVSITELLVLFTQLIYYSPSYPKTALAAHTGKCLFLIYANIYNYNETCGNFSCSFNVGLLFVQIFLFPSSLTFPSSL